MCYVVWMCVYVLCSVNVCSCLCVSWGALQTSPTRPSWTVPSEQLWVAWDHGECTTCVVFVVLLLCTGDLDQYTYLQLLFGCCCLWFVVVYTLVRVAASCMCLGVVWLSLFTGWLGENNCYSIAVHCTTITTLRCHLSLSVLCWLPFLYSWTQRGTQCTCIVYTPV